jgi:hypothetical protein
VTTGVKSRLCGRGRHCALVSACAWIKIRVQGHVDGVTVKRGGEAAAVL